MILSIYELFGKERIVVEFAGKLVFWKIVKSKVELRYSCFDNWTFVF